MACQEEPGRVALALNKLADDGLVSLSARDKENFEALIDEFFDDSTDSGSEECMEFGEKAVLYLHF